MASSLQQLLPPPEQIDDTHKVYSVAIACIVLGVITSLFVLLRLGQRAYSRTFSHDDYAIIPALLLYIGWIFVAAYMNLRAGVGKPLWEITLGEYVLWFKGIVIVAWLYPVMTAAIRISILLFYKRIFASSQGYMRNTVWFLVAMQGLYVIVFSILPAFWCKPLYMAWHPLIQLQYCDDYYINYTQTGLYSVSMAFDVILLFLPLRPISKLQMPLGKRVGVGSIFMLGAAASIIAAWKLGIYVAQWKRYTHINPKWLQYQLSLAIPPQFDEYGTTFWIPSTLEPTVALIGSSLPALRHFWTTTLKEITTVASSKSNTKISVSTTINVSSDKSNARHPSYRSRAIGLGPQSESEVALGDYYELNDTAESVKKQGAV